MGWKENEDRLGRHTKTSRRQTKRTAHYKTWARWVPTTRKTGRLRQTSRHVTSRHQQGRFQLAANSPASNQASRRARLQVWSKHTESEDWGPPESRTLKQSSGWRRRHGERDGNGLGRGCCGKRGGEVGMGGGGGGGRLRFRKSETGLRRIPSKLPTPSLPFPPTAHPPTHSFYLTPTSGPSAAALFPLPPPPPTPPPSLSLPLYLPYATRMASPQSLPPSYHSQHREHGARAHVPHTSLWRHGTRLSCVAQHNAPPVDGCETAPVRITVYLCYLPVPGPPGGFETTISMRVTWCFTPIQPVRLYLGDETTTAAAAAAAAASTTVATL